MGEVYRAIDLRLGRPVALKLLAPEIADDERSRERFLRESRIAASLDHPNVIPIYEAGEADGRVFIAMRFVEGIDLRRMLRERRPLDPERALALLGPVAGALDAAHAHGLVHRDVKPANVLIARDQDEHVYLSDFGLSTLGSEAGDPDVFSGNAEYAAPELVTGGPIDTRSDVYALGCVLFECLAGEPPYRGGSVMAVLWGHVNDPVPRATDRNRALPRAIDGVLRKALAKEPARRPSSCRALLASARVALGLDARRRPIAPIAAAVASVAAAAVAVALVIAGGDGKPGGGGPAGSIVRIDPATNEVSATTAVGGRLTAVATTRDDVWATDAGSSVVVRLDAARDVVRTSSAHGVPSDVAGGGERAVVANGTDGTAAVFDGASGGFQGVIQLGGFGYSGASVASDGRWAWVASGRALKRIDLITLVRAGTRVLPLPHDDELRGDLFVSDVAIGAGSVWVVGDPLNPTLWRIDPEGERRPVTIELPFGPDAVVVADGAVWVANRLDGTVSRLDLGTNRVTATIAVGEAVEDVAAGAGAAGAAVGRS